MEERNITVTLNKAKEWFNSGNATLKEIALQAFSEEELTTFDFTKIKTFEDALTALGRKKVIIFNIYQVIANATAWLLVAPALDVLIYAEPAKKVFTQGAVSFGFNIVMVGILGSILIATYTKTRVKKGSLDRE